MNRKWVIFFGAYLIIFILLIEFSPYLSNFFNLELRNFNIGISLIFLSLLIIITIFLLIRNSFPLKGKIKPEDNQRRFGQYTLIAQIGKGGMGEVFLAKRHGEIETLMAIKRILPQYQEDYKLIAMFQDEAHILSQLKHPNIVQIFEMNKIDNYFYIAMEYVAGISLSKICDKVKNKELEFPIGYAVKIASLVCDGLDYAFRRLNLVHRDIKPQNIIIGYEGEVKILDFGIAKAKDRISETTTMGEVKGTISYMSPEQIKRKGELDTRSDIFSLGVVLYESIVGQRPFQGDNVAQIINAISCGFFTPPKVINDKIPEELNRIICKALSVERENRYSSPREMQMDLESFLVENKLEASSYKLSEFVKKYFYTGKVDDAVLYDPALISDPSVLTPSRQIIKTKPMTSVVKEKKKFQWGTIPLVVATFIIIGVFLYKNLLPEVNIKTDSLSIPSYSEGSDILEREEISEKDIEVVTPSEKNIEITPPSEKNIEVTSPQVVSSTSYGSIEVNTIPEKCDIYLNGIKQKNMSPYTFQKLEFNKIYKIKVAKIGYKEEARETVLTNSNPHETMKFTLEKDSATIKIESNPSGAYVSVDGKARGVTPLFLDDLIPGKSYKITVSKEGFKKFENSYTIKSGENNPINVTLTQEEKFVSIRITSQPATTIYIDGKSYGWAPVILNEDAKISAGKHKLKLSNPDLEINKEYEIDLKADEVFKKSYDFYGGIKIEGNIPSKIYIDNQFIGEVPCSIEKIYAGIHTLKVESPSKKITEQKILVKPDEVLKINADKLQ